jgi:hypothetical protein
LGEAASRLLAGMARRAAEARPLAENARPILRLVAANGNERREPTPGGESVRLPQHSAGREDRDGIFVSDADGD